MHLKRAFLYTIFIALAAAALAGIFAILGVTRGDATWRIIASMFSVALCSGVAMAAFDVMEKQVWRPLMIGALVVDAIALTFYLGLIWFGSMLSYQYEEILGRLGMLLAIGSIAPPVAGHIMTLSLPRSMQVLRLGSVGLVFLVAGMMSLALIFEIDYEPYYQLLGTLTIVTVFATVALRLAQRVRDIDRRTGAETTIMALQVICPRCLLEQTLPSGTSRCRRCRLKFTVEIEEPRCPQCSYALHMLTEPRCPECGCALAPEEIASSP